MQPWVKGSGDGSPKRGFRFFMGIHLNRIRSDSLKCAGFLSMIKSYNFI